jgi:septum formation protein
VASLREPADARALGAPSGLWIAPRPLVLASASATRRGLLESAGLPVETDPSRVDERAVERGSSKVAPAELALRLAEEKALEVGRRRPERLVLGADQVLDLDGEVLHKPADRREALEHLRRLAGRAHRLHSAVALARGGALLDGFVASATLTMRALGQDAMDRYVEAAGDAALSCAGAYQVEGLGVHLFEAIEGDHATILGLPLIPLLARLRGLGCLAV